MASIRAPSKPCWQTLLRRHSKLLRVHLLHRAFFLVLTAGLGRLLPGFDGLLPGSELSDLGMLLSPLI